MKGNELVSARRYLITGGAGFIGSNLIRALIPSGAEIRVLDNLVSGRAEDLDKVPVELVVGDIRDRQVVDRVMAGVQVVIALAAHTGVVQSVENPAEDMSINVEGTLNLLEAARRHRVDRFIFASTGGAIVGEAVPPVHEEMPPRPRICRRVFRKPGNGFRGLVWKEGAASKAGLKPAPTAVPPDQP
jgi:UDP-glucose 4-epimerase